MPSNVERSRAACLLLLSCTVLGLGGCRVSTHAQGGPETNAPVAVKTSESVELRDAHVTGHVFSCDEASQGQCHFILYTSPCSADTTADDCPKREIARFSLRPGERRDVGSAVPAKIRVCHAAAPETSLADCLDDGPGTSASYDLKLNGTLIPAPGAPATPETPSLLASIVREAAKASANGHFFWCDATARGQCHFILYAPSDPPRNIPSRVVKRFTLRVGQRLDVSHIVGLPDKLELCMAASPDASLERCLADGPGENPPPIWSETANGRNAHLLIASLNRLVRAGQAPE